MALLHRWIGEQKREQRDGIHPSSDRVLSSFNLTDKAAGLPTPTVAGAMALPTVYACIRVLAETVGSLPLITYRRRQGERGRGRVRAGDHPLYALLRWNPNPEMTAIEFEELRTHHVASWGNSYAEIEMDGTGRVTALWPLLPDRMEVWRDAQGQLVYFYSLPNGQRKRLQAWQVHHCRGLSSNGIVGYSPVRVAMVSVALGLATEEFGARLFANGARPGGVLEHPGLVGDKAAANLKKSWGDEYGGLQQSHRLAVLEEGMKYHALGIPPEEAQFLETRKFQAEEITRLFRMPPHKVGLMDKATFSNIEHQAIEFVTDTIRPWLVRFEQALRRDLLSTQEAQAIYFEYLTDALLRGDTKSRYEAYSMGRQWGWLSINDIRSRENMERVDNGDDLLQPLNMGIVGQMPAAGQGASSERAWVRPIVEDVAQRLAKREARDLRSAGEKAARQGQTGEWARTAYAALAQAATDAMAPVVQALGGQPAEIVERTLIGLYDDAEAKVREVVRVSAGPAPEAVGAYAGMVEAGRAEQVAAALLAALKEG